MRELDPQDRLLKIACDVLGHDPAPWKQLWVGMPHEDEAKVEPHYRWRTCRRCGRTVGGEAPPVCVALMHHFDRLFVEAQVDAPSTMLERGRR